MLINILVVLIMILAVWQYRLHARHVKHLQHELNILETKIARQRIIKEEYYDRYISLKAEFAEWKRSIDVEHKSCINKDDDYNICRRHNEMMHNEYHIC